MGKFKTLFKVLFIIFSESRLASFPEARSQIEKTLIKDIIFIFPGSGNPADRQTGISSR